MWYAILVENWGIFRTSSGSVPSQGKWRSMVRRYELHLERVMSLGKYIHQYFFQHGHLISYLQRTLLSAATKGI